MPSFDVVSEVDLQEVRNAVDQAARETSTRYDFKGTSSTVVLQGEEIVAESSTEDRLRAVVDVLKEKLIRRKIPLKAIGGGEPKEVGGGRYRSEFKVNQGIAQEAARELNKHVKNMKLKIQVQIQGDRLRISGKKRDELQEVISSLKELDYRIPLQFINYRD
ncbi:MAG TPA: YajQ family cyclic di-GMP-binding protein [Acidimicrobiia bacterium]|nr:YajQ family cyclic di-GMP-binding protein [Acidimicrobiia bacterium]